MSTKSELKPKATQKRLESVSIVYIVTMGEKNLAKSGSKSKDNELTSRISSTGNTSGNNTKDTTFRQSSLDQSGNVKMRQQVPSMPNSLASSATIGSLVPQKSHGSKKVGAKGPLVSDSGTSSEKPYVTKATYPNAAKMAGTGNTTNTGNDRVSIDKSKEALVPLRDTFPKSTVENLVGTGATLKTISSVKLVKGDKASTISRSITPSQTSTLLGFKQTSTSILPPGNQSIPKSGGKDTIMKDKLKPLPESLPVSSQTVQPPVLDEEAIIEEAIRRTRAPLVDPYSPYIILSDKSLSDARYRLKKAIEQTRQLRSAFTERVYGKYRVCLRPPPTSDEIFTRILADPDGTSSTLREEIKELKAEKEVEKKEAQKLNAEMNALGNSEGGSAAAAAFINAETAEQLLFQSAGLSLIILPEHDVTNIDMSNYPDRAPLNPETGQRVRSISAAAAAAGDVMLDRARKGATMRRERHRRRLLAGDDPEKDMDNNYSRLSLLSKTTAPIVPSKSMAPPTGTKSASTSPTAPNASSPSSSTAVSGSKSTSPPTPSITPNIFKLQAPKSTLSSGSPALSAKAIRARVQATMSNNTLLSLNPSAEELRTDGKASAATSALMEHGVGPPISSRQVAQQRFRHPFPNSIGARRRAFGPAAIQNVDGTDPLFQHVSSALPPLPTAKERRTRQPVPVFATSEVSTNRANNAIRGVLDHFLFGTQNDSTNSESMGEYQRPQKRRLTDLSILHALEYSKDKRKKTDDDNSKNHEKEPIDAMLTFNVLRTIGLIKPSLSDNVAAKSLNSLFDSSLIEVAEKTLVGEDGGQSHRSIAKMKDLTNKLSSRKRRLSDAFFVIPRKPFSNDCSAVPLDASVDVEHSTIAKVEVTKSDENIDNQAKNIEVKLPAISIRGGGELLQDSKHSKKVTSQVQVMEQQAKPVPKARSKIQHSHGSPSRPLATDVSGSRMMWNESPQQPIVLMNPNGHAPNQVSSPDPYRHHQSAANAIKLAHQLRNASASIQRLPPRGHNDLDTYIGGLHPQQAAAGYDWSQMNAAVASTHNSLAALGLNPHRAAMVNFSVQDRARIILREQQTAAAAHAAAAQRALMGGAVGHGYGSATVLQYPPVTGPTATIVNPSASRMGHPGTTQMPVAEKEDKANISTAAKVELQIKHDTKHSKESKDHGAKNEQTADTVIKDGSQSVDKVQNGKGTKENPTSRKRKMPSDSIQSERRMKTAKINTNSSVVGEEKKSDDTSAKATSKDSEVKASSPEPQNGKPNPKPSSAKKQRSESVQSNSAMTGMQFYVPAAPSGIPSDIATKVLMARTSEAIEAWESGDAVFDAGVLIDYLLAVGVAVPIPKALVANPLKDRISTNTMKNTSFGNIPATAREVIIASILLWLWKHHEDCFQKAFAKSGRIDVDPECKWLINAAVERAVLSLSQDIAKPGSHLSLALTVPKNKGGSSNKAPPGSDSERVQAKNTKLDLLASSIVSKSLMEGMEIDEEMDTLLPHFDDVVQYLDECRKCTLYSKAQERALLATLISRKATMSLPFSHAYASSMVRAGEAVGHGELFEVIQNEDVKVSTMIPYDVFTDESGIWEDPCRPVGGYTKGLTGDDLMRRAHARAMIQKSLKKLQDRHNIKGGTPNSGAYTDPPNTTSNANADGKKAVSSGSSTPRGSARRRSSSFAEPKIQAGTGSAAATSILLYEPKHHSSTLIWNSSAAENRPYGRYESQPKHVKRRSMSQGQIPLPSGGSTPRDSKNGKALNRSVSLGSYEESKRDSKDGKSTHEIPWSDVANVFESVDLTTMTATSKKTKEHDSHHNPPTPRDKTIFAPFVRKTELSWTDSDDSESDTEEDLRDDIVLSRHQVVLDDMKKKLSVFLEARKKTHQRRKSRTIV